MSSNNPSYNKKKKKQKTPKFSCFQLKEVKYTVRMQKPQLQQDNSSAKAEQRYVIVAHCQPTQNDGRGSSLNLGAGFELSSKYIKICASAEICLNIKKVTSRNTFYDIGK